MNAGNPCCKESMSRLQEMVHSLLDWYRRRGRRLSFRESSSPYHVLVAEIMLRKTTARQVDKVFREFIERYPNTHCLASASLDEVEEVLRPLGLRSRAKALVEIARVLVSEYEGRVPQSREELMRLPSVGDYVSGCVLVFCFGKRVPLVDTNVMRVLSRAFGLRELKEREKMQAVRRLYIRLAPAQMEREFHYALLDLSALHCRPRRPKCADCPIGTWCSSKEAVQ